MEERSRSTAENASLTKLLIDPKPGERWLLVTSAIHMPRAIGAFRKAGFPVEAYPVDWNTKGWSDVWTGPFWPLEGLIASDTAIRQWAGLFAYWLGGYSSELLPGPMKRLERPWSCSTTSMPGQGAACPRPSPRPPAS